ncbi:MAG: N-acetyltransferase [Bacteroidales bacterium]|jgi:GNAT superfamily N-acetyltransferase|nr:N-acetyltransferase [Bacteroidales bacterium]
MSIVVREILTDSDRKAFVNLPYRLYRNNPYWVPPLKKGELKMLTPEENPAFEFCDVAFWIAEKNGKVVGRIGAIIHHLANKKTGKKMGRFTRFELIDDENVADALINTAEAWIKNKGMEGIHGPLGFSNLDHQAVLIEGFDHIASMASEYHHEYYHKHIERRGYVKEEDWLEFRITLPETIPDKVKRVSQIVKERHGFQTVHFTSKREMEPYIPKIFDIFNEAFEGLFSTFRFNEKIVKSIIDKYMPILKPEFVNVFLDGKDETVGFIIAAPSLSKALQKARGKLFPFGFIPIQKAMKHPEEVDLLLTGVKAEYASQGLPALMMGNLYQKFIDNGVKWVETTGMQESNHVAIQSWKSWNHIQHKRKRCYQKMF